MLAGKGWRDMCYGGCDPKYLMRDIEVRVKGVAFQPDKSEEPGEIHRGGLMIWLRDFFRRTKRKDLVNG